MYPGSRVSYNAQIITSIYGVKEKVCYVLSRITQVFKIYLSSKLDLLVRVRYLNPLPTPPCPPKLLSIPTNPMRYAQPDFLNALASETPLPMIVDAECGMPLDLGRWECLWEEDADDSSALFFILTNDINSKIRLRNTGLNPDPLNLPSLDPRDAFLLADPSTSSGAYPTNGGSQPGSGSIQPTLANVSWLRKTEYITRESSQRQAGQELYAPANEAKLTD